MKNVCLLSFIILCLGSCQKEISTELDDVDPTPTDSAGVNAFYIKIEDPSNIWLEDSVVVRYLADRVHEVHYYALGDSSVKTYVFDVSGKLTEISSPEGIFDPSGTGGSTANAVHMQFLYDASGELSQINTQYSNHAPTTTWFTFSQQGPKYKAVMYDTGSTDINKRIVYYTLNGQRYLEQDSTVFVTFGNDTGHVISFNYAYDPNVDVVQSVERRYESGRMTTYRGTVNTRHAVDNPYETARKKSYGNLANWFPFTSYFGFNLYSYMSFEQPRGLVNSSTTDEYFFIFATPDYYQYKWQSTIQTKDNKVTGRTSSYSSTGLVDPWTITERFYYE